MSNIKKSQSICHRGNVKISNLQLINAILYVAENSCKWSKNGVLQRVFAGLQAEGIIEVRVKFICLDSTTVKVHPDACGALKKMVDKQSGEVAVDSQQKFIWLPRLTEQH